MGKLAFLFLALCFVVSPSVGYADDYDPKIEGCKYFCRAQHPLVEGGRDTGYDNCIVQTQAAGKCGSGSSSSKKTTELPQTGPIPESRPDNPSSSCKTEFDKYYNACQATTGEAESTCDEDNNQELKNAMKSAQGANSGGQTGSVQYACGQASNLSQDAKNAMTTYKNNCSGALTACRSSCADFAIFMNDNKCWSELGYNQQSSKTVVDSMMKTCENQQAKVSDAEKSIASFSNTNSGSNACQGAASGMSMPQESKAANAEAKTFCQMNPNTPGCSNGAVVANCNDPAQASNKVCVCSRSPLDPMCSGTQSSEFSSNSPSIDSSSRVPTSQADLGAGDVPSLPNITPGKIGGSGDSEGIDGRQNTAALGGGGGGSGSPSGSGGGSRGGTNSEEPSPGGGTYGGGGGGFGGQGGGNSGSGGGAYGRAGGAGNSEGVKTGPDLRQFLPGGSQDPKYKLQGSGNSLEKDGVTGPHSSNWRKIQNRYQILKTTLEP